MKHLEAPENTTVGPPMAVVDWDQDGAEEVLVSVHDGLLWIHADGRDLDEDELMDVLTWGSDRVALLRGSLTSDGRLEWPTREHFGDSRTDDNDYERLATADLDDDGHIDVVAVQAFWPGGLLVYFGDGAGGWDEVLGELEPNGCFVDGVQIAFIDDDVMPDIVLECETPTVLLNLGARTFEEVKPAGDDMMIEADEILVGNFGGEGPSLFAGSYDDQVARLFRLGDDETWTVTSISLPIDDIAWADDIVADLDGNGTDEVVLVTATLAGCN